MSSAANQPPAPPYHRERRRRDDMAGQQQAQTQDIIRQLSDMFTPRLKEIQDKLDTLVTRREHEKDLAEVNADFSNQQKQLDRLQTWADARPRKSADADWVTRIETDVRAIETRMAAQPEQTRATLNTLFSGGGCLYMIVALCVMVLFDVVTIGVSVGLTLLMRGG